MIDQSVEDMLYNYKYLLGKFLSIEDKISGEFESEFGIQTTTSYPVEYATLIKQREKYAEVLEALKQKIEGATRVKSIELAEKYSKHLSNTENRVQYKVSEKKIDGVVYLCVTKKSSRDTGSYINAEDEFIIDADVEITKSSTRGLFDSSKQVGDKLIPIKSFLPKEYESIFDFSAGSKQEPPSGPAF